MKITFYPTAGEVVSGLKAANVRPIYYVIDQDGSYVKAEQQPLPDSDALRKDAERYRCLRAHSIVGDGCMDFGAGIHQHMPETLDSQVDTLNALLNEAQDGSEGTRNPLLPDSSIDARTSLAGHYP